MSLGNLNSLLQTSWFILSRNFATLTSKMPPIKTFVFLDLETTSLPHLEHNSTKITEFCAVAAQAAHIELGCFPRVQNKLGFCVNPQKIISPQSTELTGLSNELLEHQSRFSSDTAETINKWLSINAKPICLVAYNGNRFDYPILRTELEKTGKTLPDDVLCVDALSAFRFMDKPIDKPKPAEQNHLVFDDGFDELLVEACEEYERELEKQMSQLTPTNRAQEINETTPKKQVIGSLRTMSGGVTPKRAFSTTREFVSYKLADVYKRLTNKEPIKVHEAEGDVTMMMMCAAIYGEKFVTFANEKCVKFSEIPMMKPGRKIGT